MVSALRGASTWRSALEFAALTDEPDGKAEERAEERGPDQQPELAWDRTEQIERRTDAAAQGRAERDETEDPDDRSAARETLLTRVEREPPFLGVPIDAFLLSQVP